MSDRFERTWRADPSVVPRVRAAMAELARAAGATADALEDVRLAVSEAATNVVLHAYANVPIGPIYVSAWIEARRLCVEIRDEGGGLRPRPDSPGLGVGLPLMAAVAETLRLSAAEGEPNLVAMTFDLDAAHPAVA